MINKSEQSPLSPVQSTQEKSKQTAEAIMEESFLDTLFLEPLVSYQDCCLLLMGSNGSVFQDCH